MRRRIAILASGTGSNAENLAAYFQNSDVAEVALLIADREAPVIDRLKPYGVPAVIVPRAEWRENPQKAVAVMRDAAVDLVVLAGFLTVVPKEVLEAFPERIVNVHPSLLPKFGGKGMWGMNVRRRRGGERHHHPLCVGRRRHGSGDCPVPLSGHPVRHPRHSCRKNPRARAGASP